MYFDHCRTPQSLGRAIDEVLNGVTFKTVNLAGSKSGAIAIIGPAQDQTLREAFLEARSRAELLRQECSDLPEVPDSRCMPLEGLHRMSVWCQLAQSKWVQVQPSGKAGQGKPVGEWSPPMSKAEMMTRLDIDSYKTFNAFAKTHGIKEAGNRQAFIIRLDTMDSKTRAKLEKK